MKSVWGDLGKFMLNIEVITKFMTASFAIWLLRQQLRPRNNETESKHNQIFCVIVDEKVNFKHESCKQDTNQKRIIK